MKKIVMLVAAVSLMAGFSSCKSKQSAYRAAYERAKQREIVQATDDATRDEIVPITKEGTSSSVVRERVVPATGENPDGLRAYSVVVGSFQNLTNATSLKERMISEGYRALLAQNEQQMYRVIVTSFDTKQEAVTSRESIKRRFAPLFQDAWILERIR